ncbi:MAG: Crp/Fnr family transcriptional regulator [Treponema sp.]|nr:Crp/Fnr family transcriptional regulator [Spirochaetia bacterium]MDD7460055.1 Crp/Fnr family transcriptional regulator [Spirochaetales bacterium]MDY5811043.1 Crp/Fnr family transcriptional regulator [Treponema sp.]MEE1181113.1 Crp/Fnr family transcriptional regulator [Treponema sp.]
MPKTIQFTQGSIIFFEGAKDSNIYILQSGSVALKSRDLETGVIVSEQVRIGEFFGVKSALAHMPSLVTASVLVNSVVVAMSVLEFEKLFSSKQAITEKMLRVFSKSLRDIHRKTESFLKSGFVAVSPEVGMLSVAQAFYNDEHYKTCMDVLTRISQINPNPSNKVDIEKLYKEAKMMEGSSRPKRPSFAAESSAGESTGLAVNQFSLPAFDRFTKKYSRGDVIISEFEPGETFYLIKYGEVQICKCINNQNKSLDILTSGHFFGEMAILDNSQRSASCIARTDVACLEFNKANFKALVLSNPQIVMNLLKIFTKRIYDQYRQFKIILIKELPVRVCDVFLMYDELQGTATSIDDSVQKRKFDITVNDIASWAAISQQQAQTELSDLVERGKIEVFDSYINIKNIHDMRRIVDNYYMKIEAFAKAQQG